MAEQDPKLFAQQVRWAFGRRLSHYRKQAGLTQMQLGERLGVDHKTISRIENGHTNLPIDRISQLAWGVGVEPARLFGDTADGDAP